MLTSPDIYNSFIFLFLFYALTIFLKTRKHIITLTTHLGFLTVHKFWSEMDLEYFFSVQGIYKCIKKWYVEICDTSPTIWRDIWCILSQHGIRSGRTLQTFFVIPSHLPPFKHTRRHRKVYHHWGYTERPHIICFYIRHAEPKICRTPKSNCSCTICQSNRLSFSNSFHLMQTDWYKNWDRAAFLFTYFIK